MKTFDNFKWKTYPLGKLKQRKVILDLNKLTKKNTYPIIYQEKLLNVYEKFPNYLHIKTEGSKDNQTTELGGAVFTSTILKNRLPKEIFIFIAETTAIDLAPYIVSTSNIKRSTRIYTLSIFKKLENLITIKLVKKPYKNILNRIPSHIRI